MRGYELVGTFTAEEFAKLNYMDVENIKNCSDARLGAFSLDANTELSVYLFSDGRIVVARVLRCNNAWNDVVDVVVGKAKNWNYERMNEHEKI